MGKSVIIIGGGIAGMEAAARIAAMGKEVILLEKSDQLGGHLRKWDRLFPTRRKSDEVFEYLSNGLNDKVTIRLNIKINKIKKDDRHFFVILEDGESLKSDALLLTTGYDLFEAGKKEEYGYGIYDNVITSADLEAMFRNSAEIKTSGNQKPRRVGFVHCVGSRDEKAGHLYCSKVCCVTGVKQAIEIKEKQPDTEIFCFYMDLRMFDRYFEDLYYEAQQKWGIQFIRGRLSESCENPDHSILVKVEDTLTGRPLKMTVDLLVLLSGFVPSSDTNKLADMLGLLPGSDGFLTPVDEHFRTNETQVDGLFLAGTVKGPATIENTITDARSAAISIIKYLEK
ncbi:MAG: FAD-dependent oxidoreductase [Bacteroidetes bacterium]|nr:FAD-dependent oxidoreductase [Bacteroidota bacterium]